MNSKGHVTQGNATSLATKKLAFQVAEKVEAASTFRNATRQVAACVTPACVAIF